MVKKKTKKKVVKKKTTSAREELKATADVADLKKFFSKISVSGVISDCLLHIGEGMLSTFGICVQGVVVFNVSLKAETVGDGHIPVPGIDYLQKILDRFEGKVYLKLSGSRLSIGQKGKRADLTINKEDQIDSHIAAAPLQYEPLILKTKKVGELNFKKSDKLIIPVSSMKALISDSDAIGKQSFHFLESKGKLSVVIRRDNDTITQLFGKLQCSDTDSYYEFGLAETLGCISGESVEIRFLNRTAMHIKGQDGICRFVYIVNEPVKRPWE